MTIMTANPRLFDRGASFDIRCAAALPATQQSGLRRARGAASSSPAVRGRTRWSWPRRAARRADPSRALGPAELTNESIDLPTDPAQRPWVRGFPVTAWFELPDAR